MDVGRASGALNVFLPLLLFSFGFSNISNGVCGEGRGGVAHFFFSLSFFCFPLHQTCMRAFWRIWREKRVDACVDVSRHEDVDSTDFIHAGTTAKEKLFSLLLLLNTKLSRKPTATKKKKSGWRPPHVQLVRIYACTCVLVI